MVNLTSPLLVLENIPNSEFRNMVFRSYLMFRILSVERIKYILRRVPITRNIILTHRYTTTVKSNLSELYNKEEASQIAEEILNESDSRPPHWVIYNLIILAEWDIKKISQYHYNVATLRLLWDTHLIDLTKIDCHSQLHYAIQHADDAY